MKAIKKHYHDTLAHDTLRLFASKLKSHTILDTSELMFTPMKFLRQKLIVKNRRIKDHLILNLQAKYTKNVERMRKKRSGYANRYKLTVELLRDLQVHNY